MQQTWWINTAHNHRETKIFFGQLGRWRPIITGRRLSGTREGGGGGSSMVSASHCFSASFSSSSASAMDDITRQLRSPGPPEPRSHTRRSGGGAGVTGGPIPAPARGSGPGPEPGTAPPARPGDPPADSERPRAPRPGRSHNTVLSDRIIAPGGGIRDPGGPGDSSPESAAVRHGT
eukprot:758615-Hanusia_phi.AAC.1